MLQRDLFSCDGRRWSAQTILWAADGSASTLVFGEDRFQALWRSGKILLATTRYCRWLNKVRSGMLWSNRIGAIATDCFTSRVLCRLKAFVGTCCTEKIVSSRGTSSLASLLKHLASTCQVAHLALRGTVDERNAFRLRTKTFLPFRRLTLTARRSCRNVAGKIWHPLVQLSPLVDRAHR